MQVAQEQLKLIIAKQDAFPGIPALAALQHMVKASAADATMPVTDKDEVCSYWISVCMSHCHFAEGSSLPAQSCQVMLCSVAKLGVHNQGH